MISVEAPGEWWCRWNWSEGYKCTKKGIFCRAESVTMSPKSRDHMPTTSLWGVTAKWPTWAPKMKLILCPRDPQGYSCISLSLSGRILKEDGTLCQLRSKPHAVFHAVCKIALTEVLATQMGVMWCSKKVSTFELYKFNPLSPHCGLIAWELMRCYTWGRLRIVTVCGQHGRLA